MTIRNFKNKTSQQLASGERTKSTLRLLPSNLHSIAHAKLNLLHAIGDLMELRKFKSLRLERLKGDRKGEYSIRINDQYRICFRWEKGEAADVYIIDYHK